MSYIITRVKQHAALNLPGVLYHLFPKGKLNGREFEIGNIHGYPGDSLKFNIQSGIGADFASDWKGDIVSLWAANRGLKDVEAALEMAAWLGIPDDAPKPKIKPKTQRLQALVVPESAPPPPNKNMSGGVQLEFVSRWDYRNIDGTLVGHIVRFHYPEGHPKRVQENGKLRKEIKPQIWTSKGWMWAGLATPSPLYGVGLMCDNTLPVLVVEGEKTADAARQLIKSHVVVAWPGAAGGIKKTDWTPCHGRDVLLFPDADAAGMETMSKVMDMLGNRPKSIRSVLLPAGLSSGWDLADALADAITSEEAEKLLINLKYDDFSGVDNLGSEVGIPTSEQYQRLRSISTYAALGYDRGRFFFMDSGGQVISFTGPGLEQTGNISQLGTINYWESRTTPGRDGFGKRQSLEVAGILMAECRIRGVFDPTRTRGLGAWLDDGQSVFHAGDKLLVDGEETEIDKFKTHYFYEKSRAIRYSLDPAIAKDSHLFLQICQSMTWELDVSATLLAGWCVIAPICGAMDWRPHLWLTSGPGAGKSWIMKNIVRRILGDMELAVIGSTTEAGIRQTLGADAIPVVYDEAESENKHSTETMQAVLQLSRQASSDGNGVIYKGSSAGQSTAFNIRSSFVFSSINTGIRQRADETRITVLALRENTESEREKFKTTVSPWVKGIMTNEFCLRLRCRAINNISTIRANAVIFADAVAKKFGTQRQGDQLGVLLAGAYLLHSKGIISQEAAETWIDKQTWEDPASVGHGITDEAKLLDYLLERTDRIRNDDGHDSTYSFSQLLLFASGYADNGDEITRRMQKNAVDRLGQYGIKYHVDKKQQQYIAVSSSNSQLASLLAGTPWSASWSRTLARLPGAVSNKQIRVGGKSGKCTLVSFE